VDIDAYLAEVVLVQIWDCGALQPDQ